MKYIVTGADGKLVGKVINGILRYVSGSDLILTTPDLKFVSPERWAFFRHIGATVLEANYDNSKQMEQTFSNGDRLYMISSIAIGETRQQQHKNAIDAAKKTGISHLTYTSFLGADRPEYTQYVLDDHRFTEKYLTNSGLKFNIMRNNLYLDNYLTDLPKLAFMSNNIWRTTAGEGKATFIPKDDSGDVAAALLYGKGSENTAYDVTGAIAYSEREICDFVSKKSGVELKYQPVSVEEYYKFMDSIHIPRDFSGDFSKAPFKLVSNDMVTNEGSVATGQMNINTTTVKDLTGNNPKTLEDIVYEYQPLWNSWIR
ncbi:NmrA family NAD(P)-binding protein [Ligilactobacillus sp. WILCCON 0076]|uniref:NmrA family NAD(P)-binding protein n=1 Tax=Ligilactobacillus ubinensis TaxID=2876789 RepID=A0A9X2JKJ0_9LACO|nr:NmrA family NAD(P)-binding protein [Ligilactobacillus ubinensis]MCP0886109.1 NmrA family NAD(P)-binding protein [Ligilactobacillus ubinensis]